jgi:hypothetical protein
MATNELEWNIPDELFVERSSDYYNNLVNTLNAVQPANFEQEVQNISKLPTDSIWVKYNLASFVKARKAAKKCTSADKQLERIEAQLYSQKVSAIVKKGKKHICDHTVHLNERER